MIDYQKKAENILKRMQEKGNTRKRYSTLLRDLSRRLDLSETRTSEILIDIESAGDLTLPFPLRDGSLVDLHFDISVDKTESEIAWEESLKQSDLPDEPIKLLLTKASLVDGLSKDEMCRLLHGIMQVLQSKSPILDQFEISAQHLLGSSKALGKLNLFQNQNEVQTESDASSFSYAVTAGKASPKKVMLIENPVSFETCLRAGLDQDNLLVCTFGFGVNWDGIVNGKKRIYPLIRRGELPNLKECLETREIIFWGDLDKGGLKIFADIKAHIPHVEFSNLYSVMLEHHANGNCHPYIELVGKANQGKMPIPSLNHGAYSVIQENCISHGVDQEIITEEQIKDIGIQALV